MPFISKDWRSPGEHWVKIGPGWERVKVLNYLSSSHFQTGKDEQLEPCYNITTRTSREIRRQNSLSEALLQLDFYSACHDIRRFNYTCRMIQLLIYNMNCLPGSVQRILIRLIEEMAAYARENGWRGEMRYVLEAVRENLLNQPVWGGQLGSAKLWQEHRLNIEKILHSNKDEDYDCNKGPPLMNFPEEVIRQILLKLSNDKDIENAGKTNISINEIADENRIWKQLAHYHFTQSQIEQLHQQNAPTTNGNSGQNNNNNNNNNSQTNGNGESVTPGSRRGGGFNNGSNNFHNENTDPHLMNNYEDNNGYENWKVRYKSLKRKYGLRKEEYAEELNLCKSCGILFWPTCSNPHDCGMALLIRVKPGDFIKYFCV